MALIVANTTNVKEMKNGRPMNVQIPEADMPNCSVVKLVAVQSGELDHVFTAQKLTTKSEIDAAIAAEEAYVIVAPEIMVEEARRTDGHIGKFRFKEGAVHTAYKLSKHDRLEVSANHPLALIEGVKVVSERKMAEAMYLLEAPAAAIVMKKIEF